MARSQSYLVEICFSEEFCVWKWGIPQVYPIYGNFWQEEMMVNQWMQWDTSSIFKAESFCGWLSGVWRAEVSPAPSRYPSKYLPLLSSVIILGLVIFIWVMFFAHYDACCIQWPSSLHFLRKTAVAHAHKGLPNRKPRRAVPAPMEVHALLIA